MSKNVIHNFDIVIKNSAIVKSSEELKEIFLKELAKISKEMNEEKDIEQLWLEYQNNNASTLSNISSERIERNTLKESQSSILPILKKTKQDSKISETVSEFKFLSPLDNSNKVIDSLPANNVYSQTLKEENGLENLNNSLTSQIYTTSISTEQSLLIPSKIAMTSNETYSDVIKTEFKKKLNEELIEKEIDSTNYGKTISKDIFNKTDQEYFAQQGNVDMENKIENLYKISESSINNMSWKKVSDLMIFKLLELSKEEKNIYLKENYDFLIKKIARSNINIQQLFSEHEELFLLLKTLFPGLPEKITFQTQKTVYPDLGSQNMYPNIGIKNMYFKTLKKSQNRIEYGYAIEEEKSNNSLSYDIVNNSHPSEEMNILGGTKILSSIRTGNLNMTATYIGKGYKNYNYDIGKNRDRTVLPGMKVKEHTHLLPISNINSSGTSVVLSENYSGPKYVNSITTSISLVNTSVTGIYYNSRMNKIPSITGASFYIVTKNTENLTVKVYPSGDVSNTVDVHNSNSITTYIIIGNSGMSLFEGKQLANPKTVTNSDLSTILLSDAPKTLKEVADLKAIWNGSNLPNPAGDHIDSTIERTMQQENNYNESEMNNEHKRYR